MNEVAWFAVGAAVATSATWFAMRRRARPVGAPPALATPTAPPPPVAPTAPTPAAPPSPLATPAIGPDARQLVRSLAEEVADLASGVEGRAHELVEAAVDRQRIPAAAGALHGDVQRLRTLHGKLLAFGRARGREPGSTAFEALLPSLVDDLQQLQLGIELRREGLAQLPPLAAGPTAVRDALLFLCRALLRAERGATHLAIATEPCLLGEATAVQIQLALEWRSEAVPPAGELASDLSYALDVEAARHLIETHGGRLRTAHLPGRSVRAIVRWPAAEPARSQPAADPAQGQAHHYGGALLLESDPAVRAMLSRELKATGRAVFACADGEAARSFLAATPDRFELLILDDAQRLASGDALAATIRASTPELKVLVLSPLPATRPADWPRLHALPKPFGVHELRDALATLLSPG